MQSVMQLWSTAARSSVPWGPAAAAVRTSQLQGQAEMVGSDRTEFRRNLLVSELHASVIVGCVSRVQQLLEAGVDVHGQGVYGGRLTALFQAAQAGDGAVVDKLLKAGVEPRAANTALVVAAFGNHTHVVRLLLAAGAEPSDMAITAAALSGNQEVLQSLRASGTDPVQTELQCWGWTPLHTAASVGNLEVVKMLLRFGADPLRKCLNLFTPLHIAVIHDYAEVALQLAQVKPQLLTTPDQAGCLPLHYAAHAGHVAVVRALLTCNVYSSSDCGSALHPAITRHNTHIVKALLASSADVETVCEGLRPLLLSVALGHADIVTLLLQAGADVTATDPTGVSLLSVAAKRGHVGVLQVLLDAGATTSTLGVLEHDALQLAVECGHVEVLQVLLNHEQTRPTRSQVKRAAAKAAGLKEYKCMVRLMRHLNGHVTQLPKLIGRCSNPVEARLALLQAWAEDTAAADAAGASLCAEARNTTSLGVNMRQLCFNTAAAAGSTRKLAAAEVVEASGKRRLRSSTHSLQQRQSSRLKTAPTKAATATVVVAAAAVAVSPRELEQQQQEFDQAQQQAMGSARDQEVQKVHTRRSARLHHVSQGTASPAAAAPQDIASAAAAAVPEGIAPPAASAAAAFQGNAGASKAASSRHYSHGSTLGAAGPVTRSKRAATEAAAAAADGAVGTGKRARRTEASGAALSPGLK